MELTNSPPKPSPSSSSSSFHHRSFLTIDLNRIPSPTETLPSPSSSLLPSPTSVVRYIHENPTPALGTPGEIPGDASLACAGCGGPPPRAAHDRVVCDGCERGFHFACAGVGVAMSDEWVCSSCASEGVSSRRWPLGRKEGVVRLLDINAPPPGDGDVETGLLDLRKHSVGEHGLRGNAPAGSLLYSNFVYANNGFGLHKAPEIVAHTVRLDFQDSMHRCSSARSFEDIAYSSQLGRIRNSSTPFKFLPGDPSEVLQSLRAFVSERHGFLEEGWRVEFKQLKNGRGSYAVYRAPNGNIFETMSDVACYLGLASNVNSVDPEAKSEHGSAFRRNGLHLPKRRKLTGFPVGSDITETGGNLISGCHSSLLSNVHTDQFSSFKHGKMLKVAKAMQEENGADDFRQFHEGLPLQCEDFFILSLGKIDSRASYHDASQIWPVGYRSCWHDKITGSLFLCDVGDGGNNGPVFKVRRFSCSALPIPYGSTVLHRQHVQLECENKEERGMLTTSDDECYIEMILCDPGLPVESDALPWLLSSPNEAVVPKPSHSNPEVHASSGSTHEPVADCLLVGEKIGEFSVDGRSASEVWGILSQKLADSCYQIYKQMGSLKFFCKHVGHEAPYFPEVMNDKTKWSFDKFCSFLDPLKIPSVVESDAELGSTIEALKNWMSVDRFGLDVEFVQELIEQSPEVHECPKYELLRRRDDYSRLPLVGNGLLLINGKTIEQCQQDIVMDGLYRKYKNKRKPTTNNYSRPPGKHLGIKLPPHLVGDVLQVWESLRRFHEVLNLEPLKFDELEAELITPWFKSLSGHGPCERDSPSGQICADGLSVRSEQTSSSSSEADQAGKNRLIKMETATMSEEAHRQALSTNSKCACVSLKRAHISLLDVLVSELQIKVAAVVDPSIEGESKSRRRRRRDVDSSILAIREKLNLLPINELTWQELARRYILAVLSMDGNVESAETGVRECGKVFRCLQGDGGVLCGSLIGLAGIEADARLLAEATRRIYGSVNSENDILTMEDDDPEPVGGSERGAPDNGDIPEWARPLEPVKKLPTNVGTRIRKCVYEALEKNPPDWAKKILEYSISKEVYKGNASGPTKKAVLSLLEGSQQKKKKKTVSISDIIMRQCRILLRRAASADEDKVFCNLLGRNLMNSSENDDEGLLGSPAMVSRPLDFRTIDLRLAVGAYAGSHEAFLEDVRELWQNIRIAHADQPKLVQLAETLSQNFEELYEDVISLVGKLKKYLGLEQMSTEAKEEIGDIVASTSKIPKAPWDEGVCKICAVDKDDDSVLLCDTCDAEYHTYCLNPPLARIPQGNWYCPSCVSGVNMLERMAQGVQFISQRHRRKYHGDDVRNYLEELGRLASVMERQEYWEFSVDERILLLRVFCDEVLNSIRVRQHLEKCLETSADLQQKLRLSHSEWKSLKSREDLLTTKAVKFGVSLSSLAPDSNIEERTDATAKHGNASTPESVPKARVTADAVDSSKKNGCHNVNHVEKDISCRSDDKEPMDSDCHMKDIVEVVNEDTAPPENHDLPELSKCHKPSLLLESTVSNPLPCKTSGIDSESSLQGAVSKSEDSQGALGSSSLNEAQTCKLDLISVQKDLTSLQQSIVSIELQLMKSSMRMEFLGSDSCGRLYWVSSQPGGRPWVIVDGTIVVQPKTQGTSVSTLTSTDSYSPCPFAYGKDSLTPKRHPWVSYESDTEIRELVKSLRDTDPKERELKDSILHWLKLRFHDSHQTGKQGQGRSVVEKNDEPNIVTKAFTVLEHKYGTFFQANTKDHLKKRKKRSRVTNNEKLYRCKCLEPIWPSRHHCLSCHITFFTSEELDRHNDGNCKPNPSLSGKKDPNDESSRRRGLGTKNSQSQKQLQNEDAMCPYKFDEVKAKFVTNNSIKELVNGIGLIGTEGAVSIVPTVSPYLSDPTLKVLSREDVLIAVDQSEVPQKEIVLSDQVTGKNRINNVCPRRIPAKKHAVNPHSAVPDCSLRPLVGGAAQILRQLKINLLDMEAALPEEAFRRWKVWSDRRRAWHAFVKAAETIFEMVQATIVLDDMIKTGYMKNEWWYWSSLSAAAKTSTLSSLALRIYALDNCILYEKIESDLNQTSSLKAIDEEDNQSPPNISSSEKSRQSRRSNKKRKEAEG